ncbi:hypothetical protein GGQ84_001558 [Desulfitispora alkaliphila]|uniref:hypothetical protein n=1 Tax=Desulfitispora alkaliphila TaxID=622674 RepID=UPI003D1BD4CA
MKKQVSVNIEFINKGLRSSIKCSLCANCPKGDNIGCCTYSPTFTPVDLGYYLENGKEDFLKRMIVNSQVTVLTGEITFNAFIEGVRYCFFHSDKGCDLSIEDRDSICRQFLCPEVKLWHHSEAKQWAEFWEVMAEWETRFNHQFIERLEHLGISLEKNCDAVFELLREEYPKWKESYAEVASRYPERHLLKLNRMVTYKKHI